MAERAGVEPSADCWVILPRAAVDSDHLHHAPKRKKPGVSQAPGGVVSGGGPALRLKPGEYFVFVEEQDLVAQLKAARHAVLLDQIFECLIVANDPHLLELFEAQEAAAFGRM
jgi:hypothetical protein